MERLSRSPYKYVVPAIFLLLPFLLPQFSVTEATSSILGPTSFIFSIMAGFFLADVTANYRRLKALITNENSELVVLYTIASNEDEKQAQVIADAIDAYMIAQLDYGFLDHVPYTYDEFNRVVDESKKNSYLYKPLGILISIHQEMYLVAKKSIGRKYSTIILTLGSALTLLLILGRDGSLLTSTLIGIILFSIYEVIFLLFDIDSNRFLARQLAYKTPQYVFSSIGRLPYYPETAITQGTVKEPEEEYRVGLYTDLEHSYEKEIKTVESKH